MKIYHRLDFLNWLVTSNFLAIIFNKPKHTRQELISFAVTNPIETFHLLLAVSSTLVYLYACRCFYDKHFHLLAYGVVSFFYFGAWFYVVVLPLELYELVSGDLIDPTIKNIIFQTLFDWVWFFYFFLCKSLFDFHKDTVLSNLTFDELEMYFYGYLVGFVVLTAVLSIGSIVIPST